MKSVHKNGVRSRPFERRYMYYVVLALIVILSQNSKAAETEDHLSCGYHQEEVNFAAVIWYSFSDLENSYSIASGEALAIEYSVSEQCVKQFDDGLGVFFESVDGKDNLKVREDGISDDCLYISISKLDVNSPFEFSSKFKRRIYASKIKESVTIWFTVRDKETIKLDSNGETCIQRNI